MQEFPLNYTSIMVTLEFCFARSEDCVLLLDPINRNLNKVLAFLLVFLTFRENGVKTRRPFLAFSIFLRDLVTS